MSKEKKIVVTGAAGFIGSCLVALLNERGHSKLILVDDFEREGKNANLDGKKYLQKIHRDEFIAWLEGNADEVGFVFHIGARTDTTEPDMAVFDRLNLNYSKSIWTICSSAQIPLVYASSAATYGGGEHGFEDRHNVVEKLEPLNAYGISKNEMDKWALKQENTPPFWAGLKFFNVYGPNECHKGRMASVIFHAYHQIKETGCMKLFRSHHPNYPDGGQLRDFIYVKDLLEILYFLFENPAPSGLYNVGTAQARSFLELATAVFQAMGVPPDIQYIDTPEDIRDKYQYFTEAKMDKLRAAGYNRPFYSLEEGVADYVQHYLIPGHYY